MLHLTIRDAAGATKGVPEHFLDVADMALDDHSPCRFTVWAPILLDPDRPGDFNNLEMTYYGNFTYSQSDKICITIGSDTSCFRYTFFDHGTVDRFVFQLDDTVQVTGSYDAPFPIRDKDDAVTGYHIVGLDFLGNRFDNSFTGGRQADILSGLAGNDVLHGAGGDDRLLGGEGHDRLNGGAGNDVMAGGAGNDTYRVDSPGDRVIEAAGQGIDTVNSLIDLRLARNVENLTLLGQHDLAGTGNALANLVRGNAGANALRGMDGNDVLQGGAGDDILNGGRGADRMQGGAGDDSFVVDNAGDRAVEYRDQGADTVLASVSFRLAANVENLTLLGTLAINGAGTEAGNALRGNAAANVLTGRGGNDTLHGGGGGDVLSGGTGNDRLFGASGNDLLIGGPGIDAMTGGTGADTFRFTEITDSLPGAPDRIADFTPGEDRIDLRLIDADSLLPGDQAFTFIGADAFGNTAGELRHADGLVLGDVNGDGIADFQIGILNSATPTADDFIL